MNELEQLRDRINELERRILALESHREVYRYSDSSYGVNTEPVVPCMFDGLKPGVYGISCTCPKCSARCV